MEIRKVKAQDINNLVNNRMEFEDKIKANVDKKIFKEATKLYLEKHIDDGSIISYIAVDGGRIVSSCILCIYETIPLPSCISGKIGLLLNVYTLKEYRRKGIAYKLLSELFKEAKKLGVSKIELDYTDEGYPLYKKLGFESCDSKMKLNI